MPSRKKEGKKKENNGMKRARRQRILRLVGILFGIFVLLSSIAGIATYRVVSAYMADVPEFNPKVLVPSLTSFLYDKDGNEVTPLLGVENRIYVPLSEISPHLINAFIAIEDERYFDHPGFDLKGIIRAAYNNYFKKGSTTTQGGSTITQQLVKNAFLTPKRDMKRKVQELYLSYQMERIYTKEEILEFYLNRIFFDFNAYGVEAAAQTYFGKSASEVTLAEAAMLAGIPNLPARNPVRSFDEAKSRQVIILSRMADLQMITRDEAREARNEDIRAALVNRPGRTYPYPWFVDHVILDELPNLLGSLPEYMNLNKTEIFDVIYKGGLHVYTTLDPALQQVAEDTINNEKLYPAKTVRPEGQSIQPQSAVIVATPATGYIRAMVGGREYSNDNKFNRAMKGRFAAGSVLKPILAYAPAFNEGLAVPATVLDDAPSFWTKRGSEPYFPRNYDKSFRGLVTAREALIRSLNIPAIRLLDQVGVQKSKEYAVKMGMAKSFNDSDDWLAMVVGGLNKGAYIYETAQAFSVLANEGLRTDFTTVTKIVDRNNKTLYEHKPTGTQVISPEAAWLTTSALQDAVRSGTAAGLRISRPVAAKTGTSDQARNAWMAAYSPDVVAVFWIGQDKWTDDRDGNFQAFRVTPGFMNPILKAAHEGLPVRDFKTPGTLKSISVCNKSGLRPGTFCPTENIVSDWFPATLIPTKTCELHVEVEVCKTAGLLAGEFCPPGDITKKIFLNRPPYIVTDERWKGDEGRRPADAALMPPTEVCTIHSSRPSQPKDVRAEVWNNNTVILFWNPGDGSTNGYLVYRKKSGEDTSHLLTPAPITSLSLTDNTLEPGTYSYQVVAVNREGVKSTPVSAQVTVEQPVSSLPEYPPQDGNGKHGNGNSKKND